jgi:hypothetical protein
MYVYIKNKYAELRKTEGKIGKQNFKIDNMN